MLKSFTLATEEMGVGLTLPSALQRGILAIQTLSEAAAVELKAALLESHVAAYSDALAEEVAVKVSSIPRPNVDIAIETLSRLRQIGLSAEVPLDEFVDDIYDAMAEGGESSLKLQKPEQDAFKERLRSLLDVEVVTVLAKARLVFVEHEHYLCYARIMTDVRPIFGERVDEDPQAATIVHSLKIAYHDADEVREFFVALDEASLDRLGELIARAKVKGDTLKKMLHSAGVRYLAMTLE